MRFGLVALLSCQNLVAMAQVAGSQGTSAAGASTVTGASPSAGKTDNKPYSKTVGRSDNQTLSKPDNKTVSKTDIKTVSKSDNQTDKSGAGSPRRANAVSAPLPGSKGASSSSAAPAKPASNASAQSSGPSKSVSMVNASPLAPPMQPKIDTSTPAKPAPAAAPPAAAGSNTRTGSPYQPSSSYQPGTPYQPTGAYQPPAPYPPSTPSQPQAPNASAAAPGAAPGEDNYPVIGTLETSIFGTATPHLNIEERLGKLETAVYKKTFASETLFDRTERLKATLMGLQPPEQDLMIPGGSSHFLESAGLQSQNYFDSIAALPENQVEVPPEELQRYFFVLLNGERQKFGYAPLAPDEVAQKLAKAHAAELCSRRVLSHQDLKGNNPDRRYTLAGGNDLLYESIVSIANDPGSVKLTRAIAVNLLKTIMNRQDEREALLSADATGLGFAIDWTKARDKVVACSDVLTRHGVIQPIPNVVQVGDKIEVKGVIMPPFHFEKITVAWEGKSPGLSSVADESEEALPYFAPLDYTAYAHHSDNDHSGTITALKTAGIIAAIAGGVFIPPVALAAPLIAMSGSTGEPKPASDIPIKGGVKVDGNAFEGRVAVNHEGKEGLYYITVWASLSKYGKPIAISRRAILATGAGAAPQVGNEDVSAERVNDDGTPANPVPIKIKSKHKHNKQTQQQEASDSVSNVNQAVQPQQPPQSATPLAPATPILPAPSTSPTLPKGPPQVVTPPQTSPILPGLPQAPQSLN